MTTALLELCQITLLRVNEHAKVMRETIFEATELITIENGQITRHQIVDMLDGFRNRIQDNVWAQIELIQAVPGIIVQAMVLAPQQQIMVANRGCCTHTPAASGMFP
jgi:hypothetical protein